MWLLLLFSLIWLSLLLAFPSTFCLPRPFLGVSLDNPPTILAGLPVPLSSASLHHSRPLYLGHSPNPVILTYHLYPVSLLFYQLLRGGFDRVHLRLDLIDWFQIMSNQVCSGVSRDRSCVSKVIVEQSRFSAGFIRFGVNKNINIQQLFFSHV